MPLRGGASRREAHHVCHRPRWRPLLADKGAELDIYAATGLGKADVVARLLKADPRLVEEGADYDIPPLHWAARSGTAEVARRLLRFGAAVNVQSGLTRQSALHYAAKFGNRPVAEVLLAHRAEVDARSESGFTPLHLAALNNRKEVAELLLAHKADPTAGMTWERARFTWSPTTVTKRWSRCSWHAKPTSTPRPGPGQC